MIVLDRYPALKYPLYRRYWLASLASVGGWQISALAMGWLIFELSGSALDLGILGAATAIPAILLTLVGGVIADRFEKRQVLLWTTSLNALLLLSLAALAYTEVVTVWHIWLIAGAISCVSGVDWPTRQSFFPHLINREALLSAVALNSVLWQATRMILPAIGGVLLAVTHVAVVFGLAAAGYLTMLVVITTIDLRLPGSQAESVIRQTAQGLQFIMQQRMFRSLILLSYASMFFLSSYMQLMPAFADLFNAGPTGFGFLMSATGVGSLLGTAASGALKIERNYGRLMLLAALVATLFLFAFAWAAQLPSYTLGLLFVVAGASGTSVFLILSTTALQAQVPDELRGRVMGIHGITYSLMPLGALFTGALAGEVGVPPALMISLGCYLLLLGMLALSAPEVRNMAAPDSDAEDTRNPQTVRQ